VALFFVQHALTEKAHHATIEQVRLDAVQASFFQVVDPPAWVSPVLLGQTEGRIF